MKGQLAYDPRGEKALQFQKESVQQQVLEVKGMDSKKADIQPKSCQL